MSIDVSIIIPNYNGARFLREAIDSALVQEGIAVEVIVVDDGSTDHSRKIIESYADSIYGIFQENQGACVARNAGLAASRGNYVLFLDSDDRVYPRAVELMHNALDSLTGSSALYGDARWMQEGKLLMHDTSCLPERLDSVAGLIGQNILTGRVLHRSSNLRSLGGFDINLPRGQEFDLHFRLALRQVKFIHLPVDVLYYRVHSSEHRISAQGFTGRDPHYFLKLNEKHKQLLNQVYGPEWPEQVSVRMAKRLWEIGRGLIREGSCEQFMPYFDAARALAPRHCISGGRLYVVLVRLVGPLHAERIGSLTTSNCCG